MAVGTIVAALDGNAPTPHKVGREIVQHVTITKTGNYATGGVTLDLRGLGVSSLNIPFKWEVRSKVGSGLKYDYIPGTNRSNGKIIAFSAGTTEFTNDAVWTTDTVVATFHYKA